MSTPEEDELIRLQKQQAQITILYTAISLGLGLWFLIPDHQKRLWVMAAAERARRLLDQGARHAGQQAMGLELASGRRDFYNLPYVLSVARDNTRVLYDKMRRVDP